MVSSSTLKELLNEYDKKQMIAISDLEKRKSELYARIPRLQEIEAELNSFAIKTAKALLAKFDRLMKVTDLVMLDIKHIDPVEHKELCKQPNDNILDFLAYLDENAQLDVTFKEERLIV